MQKGIRLNDGHVASLGLLARKDGTRKGYLSKRSADNTKWQTKWFALLQNLLFYFESDSSSRPSGLYLLEGCVCDRAPSPKPAPSAKEPLEKQVSVAGGQGPESGPRAGAVAPPERPRARRPVRLGVAAPARWRSAQPAAKAALPARPPRWRSRPQPRGPGPGLAARPGWQGGGEGLCSPLPRGGR